MADDTNRSPRRQAMLDFAEQSRHDYSVLLDARTGANRHPTFWNGTMVLRRGRDGDTPAPAHVLGHDREGRPPSDAPSPGPASRSRWCCCRPPTGRPSCEPPRRSAPRPGPTRNWSSPSRRPDLGTGARAHQPESWCRSSTARPTCVPDAVELSVAYPDAARFWHGRLESARLERLRSGLAAGKDVDSVLDPGTPFLLVSDHHGLPETLRAGPATPLAEAPLRLRDVDEGAALNVLAAGPGGGHPPPGGALDPIRVAATSARALAAHLTRHARALLANERVRVFALDGAA